MIIASSLYPFECELVTYYRCESGPLIFGNQRLIILDQHLCGLFPLAVLEGETQEAVLDALAPVGGDRTQVLDLIIVWAGGGGPDETEADRMGPRMSVTLRRYL